jgi:osmotically-inducible protein OsmY
MAMKNDVKIKEDVLEQIKWNPLLTSSEIKVAVRNGIVTLSGQVDSYLKKTEAEKEAKKVAGVRALAEDIQVNLKPYLEKTDTEIAEAVLIALKWHTSIPEAKIKVKVEDGIVTLEGEVAWSYEREAPYHAVVQLAGVRNVINNITLHQETTPKNLREKIAAAFYRSATIDAGRIGIAVQDSRVILTGKVRSLAEKEDAENAARSAPGIQEVENHLELPEPED